jgi:Zn-dependent protease with chaperone function
MPTASLILAAFAVVLAWPVPVALARANWPTRAPATALALWQAIALAGGLSMVGALLGWGPVPAGILTAYLLLNLVSTAAAARRQRRRHAQLVSLLSSPLPDHPDTRIIDHAVPLAYCLPGTRASVTVFSAGLLSLLSPGELTAVIEHEKAHLYQRHDLVLTAFEAWRSSLLWFPIATLAQREVGTLVEMLADDRSRRYADDATLAAAIVLVAAPGLLLEPASPLAPRAPISATTPTAQTTPAPPSVADDDQTRARVIRLLTAQPPLSATQRCTVAVAAIALVAVPAALLLAPLAG